MAEFPKGCGQLYKPGPIRDAVAHVVTTLDRDGTMQPTISRLAYSNFNQVVRAASNLSLHDETQAYLDKNYHPEIVGADWREFVPVAAHQVAWNPNIVTTTSDILKKVISGTRTAEGGEFDIDFKSRVINRTVKGSFAGIVLNAHGRLAREKYVLTPPQETACVESMIEACGVLYERQQAGTAHELFSRDEFSDAMDWIRPHRPYLVYNNPI